VTPSVISVKMNAKTSLNPHWNVPYSSEANIKLKLISSVIATKSNSNEVALFNVPNTGGVWAAKIADRSASPPKPPPERIDVLGPGTEAALPDTKTIPSSKGNWD